jgi:hypothetical protein
MKTLSLLAVCIVSVAPGAQAPNVGQPPHIRTALNHFTVIDPSEPITMYAIADHSSFDIERRADRLFLQPLRENVATNLFVWTASRELIYEIDPAGEVAKMDMFVHSAPTQPHIPQVSSAAPAPNDQTIQKMASLVFAEALIETETIKIEDQRPHSGGVIVRLEEVLRSKGEMYIRYSVLNLSKELYRITKPDVNQPVATQTPISMLSLQNHQLTYQTFAMFKAAHGPSATVLYSQLQVQDLTPGQVVVGVISIRASEANPPQLYQFNFGIVDNHPLTVEAVL